MSRDEAIFHLQTDLLVAQNRLVAASLACETVEVCFTTEININRARKLISEALDAIYR